MGDEQWRQWETLGDNKINGGQWETMETMGDIGRHMGATKKGDNGETKRGDTWLIFYFTKKGRHRVNFFHFRKRRHQDINGSTL
jgi:hypothetical protein